MRRDHFSFDGVNSLNFGVWFTKAKTENTPARDITMKVVNHRNGSLCMDNGRWENAEVMYSCAILTDFSKQYGSLMAALGSRPGYRRLWDSLHPGEFRLAVFRGGIEPVNTPYNRAGQFDLPFSCKPQRFLISGNDPVRFTAPSSLYNPTLFEALPMITVTGTGGGALRVGGTTVEIRELDGSMVLDCETMDAFTRADGAVVSRNSAIYAPEFPVLGAGKNIIDFDGGITGVEIVPRWWKL